jgi:hypothetical protein
MKRVSSRVRGHGIVSGVVAGAFVLAAVMLFIPSAGATSIVQLQSPGYLRNRGVAAQVTVMVACNAHRPRVVGASSTPARATLTVSLVERAGKHTAGGVGTAASKNGDFRCDGRSHLVEVLVPAKVGARTFVKGGALGQVTLKVCTPICRSTNDARTVRLR